MLSKLKPALLFALLGQLIACVPTLPKKSISAEEKSNLNNSSGNDSASGESPTANEQQSEDRNLPEESEESIPDPLLTQSWHLNNTGQNSFSNGAGLTGADLNVFPVWTSGETGTGIIVGVSDNAIQISHEDLSANNIAAMNKNYSLNSPYLGNPSPVGDEISHGTSVAGIISAVKDNGLGSSGVAPSSKFVGYKFVGQPVGLAEVIDQASGNLSLYNYSYGGYSCIYNEIPSTYINQLSYASENYRNGKGALYVKAAGNEYYSLSTDCNESAPSNSIYFGNANLEEVHNYPYVVVVGALNANGTSADYSTPGSSVWISAPGGMFGIDSPAIVTTDIEGCLKGNSNSNAEANNFESGGGANTNCNYTSVMNGTSAATPMVSGVIALMMSANPNLSWRDIKYILAKTAVNTHSDLSDQQHPYRSSDSDLDLPGHTYLRSWSTNAAGIKFHNWYGFGSIDAGAAVAMAKNYNSYINPIQLIRVSQSNINLDIPDRSSSGLTRTINVSSSTTIFSVVLTVDIEHTNMGDIGIELTSPSGTVSQLMLINSGVTFDNLENARLLSNAFLDEPSSGNWRIKVIDGYTGETGKLNSISLEVYGH